MSDAVHGAVSRTNESASSSNEDAVNASVPQKRELRNQPMELRENNRLYTSTRQRKRLGIDDGEYGRNTDVMVTLCVVDRQTKWEHPYVQETTYSTSLQYYGEIRVPQPIVDEMGIEQGDSIRTTLKLRSTSAEPSVTVR